MQATHNDSSAKYTVLDKAMIDSLKGGDTEDPFAVLKGKISNENELLAKAMALQDIQIVEAVYLQKCFISFWMGDYNDAEQSSTLAMALPTAQFSKIQLIYHIFYRGLISFHLYQNGGGEKWFDEGEKMLSQVEVWLANSKPIVENKLLLLRAELYASRQLIDKAKKTYEQSIQVARDNGYVHEQGLACEFCGHFLKSIVEESTATAFYKRAYECYIQWGAIAKARKLRDDHSLDLSE